ncbi:hypothetical protein BSPA111_07400 [Buttiauxella sp. A111]|nr:hypothetical protein BSPA111_07400 [Buttiauxella sp. A111]
MYALTPALSPRRGRKPINALPQEKEKTDQSPLPQEKEKTVQSPLSQAREKTVSPLSLEGEG